MRKERSSDETLSVNNWIVAARTTQGIINAQPKAQIEGQDKAENNKRIAKNTFILYVRTLLVMAISLFTSRVVLNTLGIEDFGIYNVVGGVVGMFTILSGSLSASISRFLTFEIGKGIDGKLSKVFSSSIFIQIALAFIIACFAEIGGCWFVINKMNIDSERLNAAIWVLHFSVLTLAFNLISVPYNALIIAHERMSAFAYIGMLEVILKLGVVFLLNIIGFDKLIIYSALLFIVSIIIRLVYIIYCERNFSEGKIVFVFDKDLLKKMFAFAGWNFIGASSNILKNQGVNIVINLFCGPFVNAARAITMQVNTAIVSFLQNFMTALNPQITKSYASGNNDYMMQLLFMGSKYSYFLLLFLSLPIILETNFILNKWLTEVPQYTVIFIQLIIVYSLIESLSTPLITAMLATGNIRNYQILVGGLQMLNFPFSYLALRAGFSPSSTIIIAICLSICCLIARLYMLRIMIKLPCKDFVNEVLLKALLVTIMSAMMPYVFSIIMDDDWFRFVFILFLSLFSTMISVYFIGLKQDERKFISERLLKKK